jgi:lipopolysaccharide biosynthesis regulator YciM
MGAALVLLLVGLGAMAAGVLIGRYYVPDDRQLRRTARHSRAYMRALGHLIARDHDTVVAELRGVVEENIDDVEPYFALGAMFRSRGEHERAIRVHQALAVRERERKKLRIRAMYELGMDFRAAGMPRRATRAMEEVLIDEPGHEGALRSLAALYEEQARFAEAAGLWERIGKRKGDNVVVREHHLYVAAAQAAIARGSLDIGRELLKEAQRRLEPQSAHFYVAAAELAAARANHRGARERLRQALVVDPALAPYVLPQLIAAEHGLDVQAAAGHSAAAAEAATDDLAEPAPAADGADGAADPAKTEALPGDATTATPAALAGDAPTAMPAALAAGSNGATAAADPAVTPAAVAAAAQVVAITPVITKTTRPGELATLAGHALVPDQRPPMSVTDRVLATLAAVERETGPRLEIALIRAQLVTSSSFMSVGAEVAADLVTRFPEALAARVATARIALASVDAGAQRAALAALAGETGALAWALRGRWQCSNCNHRPTAFSWRCGSCRRWGALRMETGVEPPPPPAVRDRRAQPRGVSSGEYATVSLLGARPDTALPAPTLASGEYDAVAMPKRSLLRRVGGWATRVWKRGAPVE